MKNTTFKFALNVLANTVGFGLILSLAFAMVATMEMVK
jgi:hypothetical protein